MNLNVLAPKAKNCLKKVPSLTPWFFIPVAKASGLWTTERNVYTNFEGFVKRGSINEEMSCMNVKSRRTQKCVLGVRINAVAIANLREIHHTPKPTHSPTH